MADRWNLWIVALTTRNCCNLLTKQPSLSFRILAESCCNWQPIYLRLLPFELSIAHCVSVSAGISSWVCFFKLYLCELLLSLLLVITVVVSRFIFRLNGYFHKIEQVSKWARKSLNLSDQLWDKVNLFLSFSGSMFTTKKKEKKKKKSIRKCRLKYISFRQLIVWSRSHVGNIKHDLLVALARLLSKSQMFPLEQRWIFYTS